MQDELKKMKKDDLISMIVDICKEKPEFIKIIYAFLDYKKVSFENSQEENDRLIFEYWGELKRILIGFDFYGEISEKQEEKADGLFYSMGNIVKTGKISEKVKYRLLDELFEQHDKGMFIFEEQLTDIMFALSQSEEEIEYLFEKFENFDS